MMIIARRKLANKHAHTDSARPISEQQVSSSNQERKKCHVRHNSSSKRSDHKKRSHTIVKLDQSNLLRATRMQPHHRRQVAVLGLLAVLMTSLLASLDPHLACNVVLFNHCEAVQVVGANAQAGNGSLLDYKSTGGSHKLAPLSPSNKKPTQQVQPEAMPTTTSPTTATLSAPMTSQAEKVRPTNSTASRQQQPADIDADSSTLIARDQPGEPQEWRPQTNHNNTNYNNLDVRNRQQMQIQSKPSSNRQPKEEAAIVVGRRPSTQTEGAQQKAKNMNSNKFVPIKSDNNDQIGQTSSAAIKLIDSPSLFPSTSRQANNNNNSNQQTSSGWTIEPDNARPLDVEQQARPLVVGLLSPVASPRQQVDFATTNEVPTTAPTTEPTTTATTKLASQRSPSVIVESVVRDALGDLMASAAGEPIYGAKTRDMPVLDFSNFDLPNGHNNHHQRNFNQVLMSTASASAPSVSLPPLSHLLTPRNPFRLFASSSSSSTPMATRYFPVLVSPKQQADNQRLSIGRWLSGSPAHLRDQMQTLTSKMNPSSVIGGPNHAHNHAHNQQQQMPQLPAQLPPFPSLQDTNNLDLSTTTRVYAHSHSAEQLERLVRAASQAGHLAGPPILPAIVSAPSGQTIAGFYIPAIEQPTQQMSVGASTNFNRFNYNNQQQPADNLQESQVSEFRHNGPQTDQTGGSLTSKIPGTDYILHPDEVRAMMNIGELAWRRQRHQTAASSESNEVQSNQGESNQPGVKGATQHQASASTNVNDYNRPQWSSSFGHSTNLMRENHAENARDYAYSESSPPAREYHLHSSDSQQRFRQSGQANATGGGQHFGGQLGGQLARQMAQSKVFPAIIRVNDQDYVHWPLIHIVNNQQQQQQSNNNEPFRSMASNQRQVALRRPSFAASQPLRQPNSLMGQESKLENSSVRLATQLTPNEIRQVEDSILETLIMAQTMQHQRKIMQALAAANQPTFALAPSSPGPGQPNRHLPNEQQQQQHKKFKPRFFARRRRRRRNSANNNNNNNQQGQQLKSALSSRQHFLDMLPLTIDDHQLNRQPHFGAGVQAGDQADRTAHVLESKLSQRLPVLLADQHTNKQPNLRPEPDLSEVKLSVDSSDAKVTVASPSPLQVFGARMSATSKKAERVQEPKSSASSSSSSSVGQRAQQVVAFVPIQDNRSRQLSLYQVARQVSQLQSLKNVNQPLKSSETQVEASSSAAEAPGRRPGAARINVDWPGMASDADYFPHKPPADGDDDGPGQTGRSHSDHRETEEDEMRMNEKRLRSSKGDQNDHRQQQKLVTATTIQRPTTGRGHFVTSQMKLQFAQDYQAREGVPIYNNNVRVAGALDRQRSLEVAATREKSLEHPGSGGEANADEENNSNEDDDVDGPPSDLDKGASQVKLNTSGRKGANNETKRSSDHLSV